MLHELCRLRRSGKIGSKARNLRRLYTSGYRIPRTFVIPYDAFDAFLIHGPQALSEIEAGIAQHLDMATAYAVRSSASVEDRAGHSFAGQFASFLDVTGKAAILEAVHGVWRSARSASAAAYAAKRHVPLSDVKMAVIVQQMVFPVVSGVAFSKNPVTGLDETIVEAISGKGDALVQAGASPWRWVWKWGAWIEGPTDPAADSALAAEVVEGMRSIAARLKRPVDAEWVYDGTWLYWVQVRPITALPERNVYSNRISREVLPGMIKPLIWSINVPLVNGAWIALLTELIGRNDLQPDELSKAFHYRAYFNMGAMGRVFSSLGMRPETLELLMGLEGGKDKPSFRPSWRFLRHLPRLLRCATTKLFYGRRLKRLVPEMRRQFRDKAATPLGELNETQLLQEISDLFALCQKMAYANIVAPLLMQIYNALFQRQLKRLNVEPDAFDLTHGLDCLDAFDPKPALAALKNQFTALDVETQNRIRASSHEGFLNMRGIDAFQTAVQEFIDSFGHFSESGNDFSRVPWREQRTFVLKMITEYELPRAASKKHRWEMLPLGTLQRWQIGPFYRRAREFRFYREAVGYHYTFGYGLFRRLFLELGKRFMSRDTLEQSEDVFYLHWNEACELASGHMSAQTACERVRRRKREMEAVREITLPDIIFGEAPPPQEPELATVSKLKGIPTSSGYYRGPVRVIERMEEFERMTPGAVAVIPYSDVSWTPLIVKAGAVVSESGGTLSHTSIIARECGIPAVVSVNGACRRLRNGMEIAVDGFQGEVVVLDDHEPN